MTRCLLLDNSLILFYDLIGQCSQRALEELKEHYKTVLSKSNSDVKGLIEDHLGKFSYYNMVKQQAPEVYGSLINLINDEFVNQLRNDVEIMIRNLSQSTKGQTVARSRVQSPTLNIPVIDPRTLRRRTSASTYISPPKPTLPITDKPSSPAPKRSAEQIEGIEERKRERRNSKPSELLCHLIF